MCMYIPSRRKRINTNIHFTPLLNEYINTAIDDKYRVQSYEVLTHDFLLPFRPLYLAERAHKFKNQILIDIYINMNIYTEHISQLDINRI